MLYKGLRFVSFIASIFVSSRVVNGQFVVTGDNQAIDCSGTNQCTVQCNDDSGKYDGVTINCGDASICTVQCDAADLKIANCFKNVEINLQNTLHLQMDLANDCVAQTMTINPPGTGTELTFSTLGILGFQSNALDASSWPYTNFYVVGDMKKEFSGSSITTPANGNAYFSVAAGVKQGFTQLSVIAGANSFVHIDCTGDIACEKNTFDATNAKHLSITADAAGTDFSGAVVTCPVSSSYAGSYGESCLIGGGFLTDVTIETDTGVRHASGTGGELWIVPGGGTYTSVTITCQEGSAAYPLDENSACWNGPTPAPTKTPTFQPARSTTSPTKSPTYAPTGNPTKVPTEVPTEVPTTGAATTKAPTPAPTRKPTSTPTDGPTAATTTEAPPEDPTDSPTEDPTQSPADAPAVSPSQSPTESPSQSPTPAPTSPVAITCGQSLMADYNGQAVTIPVAMQYSGELTIDARSSPLAVTELSGSSPGVIDNGFGDENDAQHVITVADLPAGSYSFRLDLGSAIGQFSVSTECVPTTATTSPTPRPTKPPTKQPTRPPTKPPTKVPSNDPTSTPTTPTTTPTTGNPSTSVQSSLVNPTETDDQNDHEQTTSSENNNENTGEGDNSGDGGFNASSGTLTLGTTEVAAIISGFVLVVAALICGWLCYCRRVKKKDESMVAIQVENANIAQDEHDDDADADDDDGPQQNQQITIKMSKADKDNNTSMNPVVQLSATNQKRSMHRTDMSNDSSGSELFVQYNDEQTEGNRAESTAQINEDVDNVAASHELGQSTTPGPVAARTK